MDSKQKKIVARNRHFASKSWVLKSPIPLLDIFHQTLKSWKNILSNKKKHSKMPKISNISWTFIAFKTKSKTSAVKTSSQSNKLDSWSQPDSDSESMTQKHTHVHSMWTTTTTTTKINENDLHLFICFGTNSFALFAVVINIVYIEVSALRSEWLKQLKWTPRTSALCMHATASLLLSLALYLCLCMHACGTDVIIGHVLFAFAVHVYSVCSNSSWHPNVSVFSHANVVIVVRCDLQMDIWDRKSSFRNLRIAYMHRA